MKRKVSPFITRLEKEIRKLEKERAKVIVETTQTIYPLVSECAKELGWIARKNEKKKDFTIFWIDPSPAFHRLVKILPFQKYNHFPGTNTLCKKHQLIFNVHKMEKKCPSPHFKEDQIIPRSFVLPFDLKLFLSNVDRRKWYILKPNNDAQGRGIKIVRFDNEEKIEHVRSFQNHVVSEYVNKPFLLNGHKFDLRIYVLIKALTPQLRLFVYNEGLVRVCSEKYQKVTPENRKNRFVHLSNFSINKKNSKAKVAIKQTFAQLNRYMDACGVDVPGTWKRIHTLILKSVICAYDELKDNYRKCLQNGEHKKDNHFSCFEILGFDVLLLEKTKKSKSLKPTLLEVNVTPSFHGDTELDYNVKHGVLLETMQLLGVDATHRRDHLIFEKRKTLERMGGMGTRTKKSSMLMMPKLKRELTQVLERHDEVEKKYLKNFVRVYPTAENVQLFGHLMK